VFESLEATFWVKNYFNSLSIGLNFFCTGTWPKINIFQFCEIYAFIATTTRKGRTTKMKKIFSLLFFVVVGSGIRDGKKSVSGKKI
jgi:hypothetical protein